MERLAGNFVESRPGGVRSPTAILGSLTVPGRPRQVSVARAFVTQTLERRRTGADTDAAGLLTSEIVTNAIQHTRSGEAGGTVTIVMTGVPHGVLVEVIDEGSRATPVVKDDPCAAEGHGLFLVQQLAAQWGYLRDAVGTTVWFRLPSREPELDHDRFAKSPRDRTRDDHAGRLRRRTLHPAARRA
jgi:serine/threonine-protein kinase RsbW